MSELDSSPLDKSVDECGIIDFLGRTSGMH